MVTTEADFGFHDRVARQAAARAAIGPFLDPIDLAALFATSPERLSRWRKQGIGPKWVRISAKTFYRAADIREWLENLPAEGASLPRKSRTVSRQLIGKT